MSGISNDCCLPTFSTTMRIGLILDWGRTRQRVVQQKFALRVKARFTPFRDSAGCTIAMRWQRRLNSNSSEEQTLPLEPGQGTVHIFCEHLSPGDESVCHPKPKYLRQVERNPCDEAQRFGEQQPIRPSQSRFHCRTPLPTTRVCGIRHFDLKSARRTQLWKQEFHGHATTRKGGRC